jgi:hypothetical protein
VGLRGVMGKGQENSELDKDQPAPSELPEMNHAALQKLCLPAGGEGGAGRPCPGAPKTHGPSQSSHILSYFRHPIRCPPKLRLPHHILSYQPLADPGRPLIHACAALKHCA